MADCYDVAVIGGGVVGCGVARACALAGRKTVLIEREAALASSHASGGNTGIACTAADCDEGTVEHACLERAAELTATPTTRATCPTRRRARSTSPTVHKSTRRSIN